MNWIFECLREIEGKRIRDEQDKNDDNRIQFLLNRSMSLFTYSITTKIESVKCKVYTKYTWREQCWEALAILFIENDCHVINFVQSFDATINFFIFILFLSVFPQIASRYHNQQFCYVHSCNITRPKSLSNQKEHIHMDTINVNDVCTCWYSGKM